MKKIRIVLLFALLTLVACKDEPAKPSAADQKATEGTFEKVREPKVPTFSSGAPKE